MLTPHLDTAFVTEATLGGRETWRTFDGSNIVAAVQTPDDCFYDSSAGIQANGSKLRTYYCKANAIKRL